MKWTLFIDMYKSMFHVQGHSKYFWYIIWVCISIITYFCCNKYNIINICHWDLQKHVIVKNGLYSINISYIGSHKSSPIQYGLREEFIKCIVINLPHTKYNGINVFHLDVQKNVSYTGWHKRYLIYYKLLLETAGSVF